MEFKLFYKRLCTVNFAICTHLLDLNQISKLVTNEHDAGRTHALNVVDVAE